VPENLVVVDVSAVIAVLTNEPHRPTLLRLTTGAELLSPVSLPIEIGNAFSAMFKRGRISLKDAEAAVEAYQKIVVRLTTIDLAQALELSHRLKIYAYDAYLLECCLRYRAHLLTLDAGLREAARRVKVHALEIS
jgi:predicted nucleic acid-binding protein